MFDSHVLGKCFAFFFFEVVAIKNCSTGQELAMKIIKDEAAYCKQGLQEIQDQNG